MKIGDLLDNVPGQGVTLRQDGSVEVELKSGARLRFPDVESLEKNTKGVYALLPALWKYGGSSCLN